MANTKQKKGEDFSFLEEYVLQIIKQYGYDSLSEDSKKELFPQFMAQAETRLGAKLLPLLA